MDWSANHLAGSKNPLSSDMGSVNYDEIPEIIEKYGYPQEWNPDGLLGPERYIEAHIWSDDVIAKYY